jgi:hypothetical protein
MDLLLDRHHSAVTPRLRLFFVGCGPIEAPMLGHFVAAKHHRRSRHDRHTGA